MTEAPGTPWKQGLDKVPVDTSFNENHPEWRTVTRKSLKYNMWNENSITNFLIVAINLY